MLACPRRPWRPYCLRADARPRRRPLGLHAAVRPRAVPRAGARPGRRSSCSRAASPTAPVRAAPTGYARRELFYRCGPGTRRLGARGARREARRARAGHAALPPRRARGRRRALPVADRAAARRAPAASPPADGGRAPARADRPRRAAARAAAGAAAPRSGASTSASTRSSCTPSTGARGCVDELGIDAGARARDPARRLRAPRRGPSGGRCPLPSRPIGPVVLLLRADAPLQGHRRAARGVAGGGIEARSCGSWGCRAWTSPRCGGGAAGRALRAALHRRRRAAGVLPARRPRRARPTARSTSRACCSRRSRSASRCCSATSAASPRSRRPARRAPSRPGDPARAARRAARAARRPRRARRDGRAARAAAAGPYSWDAIARAHLALYERLLAR